MRATDHGFLQPSLSEHATFGMPGQCTATQNIPTQPCRRDLFFCARGPFFSPLYCLFVPAVLLSIFILLIVSTSLVSLSYFILAVPRRECLGKHFHAFHFSCSHTEWHLLFSQNEMIEIFEDLPSCQDSPAHDSTLVAVVPSPVEREAVAESPNCDLISVNEWCDHWGMK